MRSIQEAEEQEHIDTEITLGMKSLLGVFFGLVLICGVFFGFGYSLGRGSSRVPKTSATETAPGAPSPKRTTQPLAASISSSAAGSVSSSDSTQDSAPPLGSAREAEISPPIALRKPSASVIKSVSQDSAISTSSVTPKPTAATTPPAAASPIAKTSPAVSPASSPAPNAQTEAVTAPPVPTMVQIAAVSHHEDADVLVAALKKRGYSVVVRSEPKDDLLHVQVGPFATREAARAMRAKLLADGYNAILK